MKCFLLVLSILIVFDVSAKSGDAFKIKIGHATLEGVMPGKRTKRAPDLAIDREFDICAWLEDEDNQKHNAQKELLRKLWEFKKIFKAPHGSLVFTVSIVNNKEYGNSLRSYYEGVAKATIKNLQSFADRGYTDHNYTPAEGYMEFELDGHKWMKYNANYNSVQFYRTFISDDLVLRINLIQSDDRSNAAKGQWHPEAEKMANQIIESIELSLPSDGKLCN